MGGYGSGYQGISKQVVENCLALDVRTLARKGLIKDTSNFFNPHLVWTNTRTGEVRAKVGYTCLESFGFWFFTLSYSVKLGNTPERSIEIPISLERVKTYPGRKRWHFRCPSCNRRVNILYLPPGCIRFACRKCHDLTYTSCQEAHKYDRFNMDFMRRHGFSGMPNAAQWKAYKRICKLDYPLS